MGVLRGYEEWLLMGTVLGQIASPHLQFDDFNVCILLNTWFNGKWFNNQVFFLFLKVEVKFTTQLAI